MANDGQKQCQSDSAPLADQSKEEFTDHNRLREDTQKKTTADGLCVRATDRGQRGLSSSEQDQAERHPQHRYSLLVQSQFELKSWAAIVKGLDIPDE